MKRWGWPGHGAAIQVCVAVTAAVGVVMLSTYINKQARCVPSSRLLAPIEREGERERERERSCGSLSTQNAAAMRAAHTQLPLSLTHPSLSSHSHLSPLTSPARSIPIATALTVAAATLWPAGLGKLARAGELLGTCLLYVFFASAGAAGGAAWCAGPPSLELATMSCSSRGAVFHLQPMPIPR
jgi:hypothetical protein